tara:strand:- start:2360 stop:3397 length:1038 start_codon:yes stop_codon:yes gene_type:complete
MNIYDFEQIKNSSIDWNKFKGKTILVTGANGILPAYMVESLLLINDVLLKEDPCKVIGLARNIDHFNQRFESYLNNKNLEIIHKDVLDEIEINTDISYIVHAASLASPKYYKNNSLEVILPNVKGTINTLELAKKHNIDGYLYFSSVDVYGSIEDGDIFTETNYGYLDPTSIRSCYAESKRMGENLCVSYGHQYNIPIKIVRPSHTYGPGMKLNDGRVFADFVKNVVNNENIEMTSDGSARRPFCYISDATVAFFKVLLDGEPNNAYNVSNSKMIISIKDLASTLVNLYPEKGLKVILSKENEDYIQSPIKGNIADTSKLERLDWKPEISIEEGFKRTIESYSKK